MPVSSETAAAARGRGGALGRRLVRRYEQFTPARALFLVLVLGALARCAHLLVFGVDQPLVMGGLFLQFAEEIAANGFLLPERIPYYSEGGLPFLYPPLAFYLLALPVHVFGLPEGPVINLLPVLISLFSIWLFYRLARRVLPSWRQAALGAFLFALLPNAMAEQMEAAGLAESLGTAMLLFFLITLADFYSAPGLRRALLSGCALGLCALSSPGSAVGGALTAVLFAGFFWWKHAAPRAEKLRGIGVIAAASLLVASPWLLHVATVGAETFAEAFATEMRTESLTGGTVWTRLWSLVTEFPLVYPPVFLWQFLAGLGLLAALVDSRTRIVAVWTLAVFLLVPREGRWLIAPGVAFLALLAFQTLFERARRRLPREGHAWAIAVCVLTVLFLLFPYGTPLRAAFGTYTSFGQSVVLREDAFAAFDWIGQNTPEDARLLVVANDYTLEQAPHETRRTVINVLWGSEFQRAQWTRINTANEELIDCTGAARECVVQAAETLNAKMPLYVLARSSWLEERNAGPEGLLLLHKQGKLAVLRLWPEPAAE
ncbi:MAG: hypothetical protein ACLFWF_07595 [Alphaproteobacteria bacterium]